MLILSCLPACILHLLAPRSGVSSRIVDVNCGTYATWATTADGHVLAWGLNNYGQLALPGGWAGLGWPSPWPGLG